MLHFFNSHFKRLFKTVEYNPCEMPQIDYKDNFTVKHSPANILARICATLLIIIAFSVLWIVFKRETRFLFIALAILSFFLLILTLNAFSYKCMVNEELLCFSSFGALKKKIQWADIVCVKIVSDSGDKDAIITLCDRNGNCDIEFYGEMLNAWYIVKMAEHKGIEVQKDTSTSSST